MLECWNFFPKLVYPLGHMGKSFSTLAFKLWICLILFRTCLPQIQIFGGISKCNNSVSFTDRSTNFSPISLKNYFLNFEKNIFWNFWFFWDFFFGTEIILATKCKQDSGMCLTQLQSHSIDHVTQLQSDRIDHVTQCWTRVRWSITSPLSVTSCRVSYNC